MFNMYIVCYLFLAGVGSGAYTIAAVFSHLGHRAKRNELREYREISRGGFWLGPLLVALGAVFLLFDLGSPEIAFTVLLSAKPTILNFGAWAIMLFCFLACASFFLQNLERASVPKPILRVVETLTFFSALSVMTYTGVLVSSMPAVPFLHTPLVVTLLILSSLSSGAALIALYGFFNQHRKSMNYGLRIISRIKLTLVALEVLILAAMLVLKYFESETARESVNVMLLGESSFAFWFGIVLLGVFLPIILDAVAGRPPQPTSTATWSISATAVLVSAFALRYCLLASGLHIPVQLFWSVP